MLGLQFPAAALFDFARALGQPSEEGVNLLLYLATNLHVFAFSRIVLMYVSLQVRTEVSQAGIGVGKNVMVTFRRPVQFLLKRDRASNSLGPSSRSRGAM